MVLPLIIGAALAGGGWLAGRSASGGDLKGLLANVETKKETRVSYSSQVTDASQYSVEYSPVIVLGSPNAGVQKGGAAPSLGVRPSLVPVVGDTVPVGGSGRAGGVNIMDLVVLGGLGLAAYVLLGKK